MKLRGVEGEIAAPVDWHTPKLAKDPEGYDMVEVILRLVGKK